MKPSRTGEMRCGSFRLDLTGLKGGVEKVAQATIQNAEHLEFGMLENQNMMHDRLEKITACCLRQFAD